MKTRNRKRKRVKTKKIRAGAPDEQDGIELQDLYSIRERNRILQEEFIKLGNDHIMNNPMSRVDHRLWMQNGDYNIFSLANIMG